MHYDVFISYCRDGGVELARLLYDRLREHKLSVFFDIEEMRSGSFNTQLYDRIAQCGKVLLILPPNGLDRCRNEDDWVRLELEHALKLGKVIIPVMMRNFSFPEALPESLAPIRSMEGVEASQSFFDATVERIYKLVRDLGEDAPMPKPQVRLDAARSFASCGMESTVFKLSATEERLDVQVNFEPTRIRPEIPSFAGIYFTFGEIYRAGEEGALAFEACSADGSITRIQVEIKPEGRKWMHESFQFELSARMQTFTVPFDSFQNTATCACMEEITFVLTPLSFADENNLRGQLQLQNLQLL